jgi:hypothetical protein
MPACPKGMMLAQPLRARATINTVSEYLGTLG